MNLLSMEHNFDMVSVLYGMLLHAVFYVGYAQDVLVLMGFHLAGCWSDNTPV